MKNLNILIIILALTGCVTKLEKAGQDHALVFKKWQALANYAGDTLSESPIMIVGNLVVTNDSNGLNFSLVDFHLTKKETPFQINLRAPSFKNKYICIKKCLQLTEYLSSNAENKTLLKRYFDKYEYELFELYGLIYSLEKSIHSMKDISTKYFDDYLLWLVNEKSTFNNLPDFSNYLKTKFSVEAYTQFLQDPHALYSAVLTSDLTPNIKATWLDNEEVPSEMFNWNSEPLESTNWDSAPLESSNWDSAPLESSNWDSTQLEILSSNNQNNLFPNFDGGGKNTISFDTKPEMQPEIGDILCHSKTNTFGKVIEVRGTTLTVSMIGQLQLMIDGIKSEPKASNSFSSTYPKYYSKIEGEYYFQTDDINVCELKNNKIHKKVNL